jgi:hypothetical protein
VSKGTKDKLQDAHDKLTDMFIDLLDNGVPVKDETTGEVHKAPPPAAYVSVLRQFLKDNNVEAIAVPKSKMAGLVSRLPFEGAPAYEDQSTHATH